MAHKVFIKDTITDACGWADPDCPSLEEVIQSGSGNQAAVEAEFAARTDSFFVCWTNAFHWLHDTITEMWQYLGAWI